MMSLEDVQKLRRVVTMVPICNKECGPEIFCGLASQHSGECTWPSPLVEALSILDRLEAELTGNKPSKVPPIQDAGSGDHEWFQFLNQPYRTCRKCNVVRRADGKNRKHCPGVVKLSLRR